MFAISKQRDLLDRENRIIVGPHNATVKQLSHNAGQCHASRQRDPQSSTRKSKDCAKKAEVDKCSQLLTCIFTCSLTHSLTHSFIHSLTHSLTPSLLPLHSSPTPHSTLHLISPTSFHAPSLTLTHALTPARPYFIQVPSLYAIHWTDAAYFFLPSLVCFIPTLFFKTIFPESACAKGSSKALSHLRPSLLTSQVFVSFLS